MIRPIKLAPLKDNQSIGGHRLYALEDKRHHPYLESEERLVYFTQDGKLFCLSPDCLKYVEFSNEDDG